MAPSCHDDSGLLTLAPVPLFIPAYNCTSLTCLFTARACTPWPSHPDSPWPWPCYCWPCRYGWSPPVNCVQEQHWEFQKRARLMKTSYGEWTGAGDGARTSKQSPVGMPMSMFGTWSLANHSTTLALSPTGFFVHLSLPKSTGRPGWSSLYLCLLKAGNSIGLLILVLYLPLFRQSLAKNASSPSPLSLLFLF